MKALKKTFIVLMATATVLFAGCAALTQLVNLVNCKFNLANISDITWAGINLSNIRNVSDLSFSHLQKAATAIANRDFAVSANVNVNVKNETPNPAKLFAFDYDLLLENSPLASGQNKNHTYTINPNSIQTIPVPIKAPDGLWQWQGVQRENQAHAVCRHEGEQRQVADHYPEQDVPVVGDNNTN